MWKDGQNAADGPTHSAQMVVDGVSYLSDAVYNIGAQPSKALTDWVADKFAPAYWKPNPDIIVSATNSVYRNSVLIEATILIIISL